MTRKIRLGVIGLGGVATAHLDAIRLLDTVEVASVCDVREDAARAVAREFSARPYADHHRLLRDGGIDLAMVLTPAGTHCGIVRDAAAAGVDVFCEKPLAVTLADGEAMVEACRAAGVRLFYGACYRYLPAVRKARELVASGAIGRIRLMTEQLVGGSGHAGYEELGPAHYPPGGPGGSGMGLVDHGIHLIDLFCWLAGGAPVHVAGRGQLAGAAPRPEFVTLSFEDGATGHLLYDSSTYSSALPNEGMFSEGKSWRTDGSIGPAGLWDGEPGSISIHGTEGALRVFHYANALFLNTGEGPRRVALEGRPAFGHFATQLEDCVAAIRDGAAPPVGGADGLRALKALLSVYDTPAGRS